MQTVNCHALWMEMLIKELNNFIYNMTCILDKQKQHDRHKLETSIKWPVLDNYQC